MKHPLPRRWTFLGLVVLAWAAVGLAMGDLSDAQAQQPAGNSKTGDRKAGSGSPTPPGYGNQKGKESTDEKSSSRSSHGEKGPSRMLTAAGVPNDRGQLRWPQALRAQTLTEEGDLREQIEALFFEAAEQATQGEVAPGLIQELGDAIHSLRKRVLVDRPERYALPLTVSADAERFLDKLDHGCRAFAAGLGATGGESELSSKTGRDEVSIRDDAFEPRTITVTAGTTVWWTNDSKQRHTVAADDDRWSSFELRPRDVYHHTFTQPGTYPYHCANHPRAMRATVIVK